MVARNSRCERDEVLLRRGNKTLRSRGRRLLLVGVEHNNFWRSGGETRRGPRGWIAAAGRHRGVATKNLFLAVSQICARMERGIMIATADCADHRGALAIETVVAEGSAAETDNNSVGRAGGVVWRIAAFAFAWWHECELTSGRPTTTAATTAPTPTRVLASKSGGGGGGVPQARPPDAAGGGKAAKAMASVE